MLRTSSLRVRRLQVAIVLLAAAGAPGSALAEEGERRALLVATRHIEPAPYSVTLPPKIGLLEAGRHRVLSFEAVGRVSEVAKEGQRVAADEAVAQLDRNLEEARLRQAELRRREAKAELVRVRGLRKSNAASAKGLDNAELALGIAEAELVIAREQLARRSMIAPFEGVVAETFAEAGEVVNPGAPVATLMELDPLRLELGVPGYQITEVRQGAEVFLTLPALPGRRFTGHVDRVASAAPEGRHLFEVEVSIPNSEGELRPGMSARAGVVTTRHASALVVPAELAVRRGGRRVVFFVEGERAVAVDAEEAVLHADKLVLPGSLPQRELVLRGHRDLQDGVAVRVDNRILAGLEGPR